MNTQDNKMAAISTGQESHEVHLCRRCGWPFPNSHPSARHRRAHKKLCGTIEGYKIINSEEHLSDDDHASDEDESTPSNPKAVKKTTEEFGSSSGVRARSNKSEDDVFSDAVTEFSDSGISPRLEERFESVRELDKILEQKRLEAHLNGDESTNVDDTAAYTIEQVNDQIKSAEGASVGLITGLQPDLFESEIPRGNKSEYGNGESQQGQMTDESAPITVEPEEVRISDQTEIKEELCDKLVSDQTERTLQNSNPSAEISGPVKTVRDIAHSEETRDDSDAYVTENTLPEEILLNTPSVKSDGLAEQSDAKPVVSSIEIKVDENQNLEESDSYSVDKMLIQPESVIDIESKDVNQSEEKSSCEISGTRAEKVEGAPVVPTMPSNGTRAEKVEGAPVGPTMPSNDSIDLLNGTRAEKVEGAPVGPTMPSNDSIDLLRSHEAADLLEPSKTEPSPPEPMDNDSDKKTFERLDTVYFDMGDLSELEDNIEAASSEGTTEQLKSEPINAAQMCAELNNHNGDEENSEKSNPSGQEEALPVKKEDLNETSPDVVDVVPPLNVQKDSNEVCAANSVVNVNVDDVIVDSKSLHAEVDEKLDSHEVDGATVDLSANNSSSRDDSLEAKCQSITDTLETHSQKPNATTIEAHAPSDKSDTFEAPSFMTLVQSEGEDNNDQVTAVSEIETVKNNQQLKSNALEAGWFPSLTNVSNESEGRKKNEEIIAKVTKWSPVKQHGALKNLLNEVKSPDTEKVKDHETHESKDVGAGADVATTDATAVVVGPTDQKDAQAKDVEQWNSPARYPIEIKKETKKKGRSLWVPFICCSSVHRDL